MALHAGNGVQKTLFGSQALVLKDTTSVRHAGITK